METQEKKTQTENVAYTFALPDGSSTCYVRCHSYGHYDEPEVLLPAEPGTYELALDFEKSPGQRAWAVRNLGE